MADFSVALKASLARVADRLVADGLDPMDLREKHFASALREELAGELDGNAVTGKVIAVPHWRSLGRSGTDIALLRAPDQYVAIGELKWCQARDDKIYEGIWDLMKVGLGLLRPDTEFAFLSTGAPAQMWPTGFCADLFDGGRFRMDELCTRMLPRGREPRWLAWDALLYGGYDRYPEAVPAELATEPLGTVVVNFNEPWEIRTVAVSVSDPTLVPFEDGWPRGHRPAGARRPLLP